MNTDDIFKIGRRIRAVREWYGIKAIDLCRELSFHTSAYSNWEAGLRRPTVDHMIVFADHFSVTLDWIYRGSTAGMNQKMASYFLKNKKNIYSGTLRYSDLEPKEEKRKVAKNERHSFNEKLG